MNNFLPEVIFESGISQKGVSYEGARTKMVFIEEGVGPNQSKISKSSHINYFTSIIYLLLNHCSSLPLSK